MYFYRRKEGQVEKYEVLFDENELQRIMHLVIMDCSVISQECGIYGEPPKESDAIFDIQQGEYAGRYDIGFGPSYSNYKYYYKRRHYSRMVGWIDSLLNGDVSVLKEIYAARPEVNESALEKEYKRLCEKNNNTSELDLDKKSAILDEMKKAAEALLLNKETKPEFYYYDTLLSALHITLVSAMAVNDFDRALEFIGKTPQELGIAFLNTLPVFDTISPEANKQM